MSALNEQAHKRRFSRTHIKLCGMFRERDIKALLDAQPDMCGFVVDVPGSHRSVSPERLVELCALFDSLEDAENKLDRTRTDQHIERVGVFVDMPPQKVTRIAVDAKLDGIQLHGSEDAPYIEMLRKLLATPVGHTPYIIQAFRIRDRSDIERARASHADLVLLDNGQGTGHTFDWSLVREMDRPFILAGGLEPNNVAQAVREVQPWGVDMSSGIETDGFKDPEKMTAAIAAVRKADR